MQKNSNKPVYRALVAAITLTFSGLSVAQAPSADWQISAGLGIGFVPEYRGADTYKAMPLPWFQASKGAFFANPLSGIGYNVVSTPNLTIAPIIVYAPGRDNTGAISRFRDVDGGLLGGIKLAWTQSQWQLQTDVVTALTGDLDGVRIRGYLRYLGQLSDNVSYGFGPDITWGNKDWNRALFEVSASDSVRSGVPSYKADGSFVRPGVNGRLSYRLTPHLAVSAIARYSRITGNASDSPIVDDLGDADQWFGSVFLNYRF